MNLICSGRSSRRSVAVLGRGKQMFQPKLDDPFARSRMDREDDRERTGQLFDPIEDVGERIVLIDV